MKKILIIRFSSIGDIILTSPVLRCTKMQAPETEIHYLTKKSFEPVIHYNPHIDKIYTLHKPLNEIIPDLQQENYDFIVDLHRNLRSRIVKSRLNCPSGTFPKLNFSKWLLVNFRWNRLPEIHIVDRYFQALQSSDIKYDGKGLDYFIPEDELLKPDEIPGKEFLNGYILAVVGGKHKTKQIPSEKMINILNQTGTPVIFAGGAADAGEAENIIAGLRIPSFNACGKFSINKSADLVRKASVVLTPDTGLMHIAAAFRKPLVTVWGNTIPEFGMYTFIPDDQKNKYRIHEVKGLNCRPCSKLGFEKCPKGHFRCMHDIPDQQIINSLMDFLSFYKKGL